MATNARLYAAKIAGVFGGGHWDGSTSAAFVKFGNQSSGKTAPLVAARIASIAPYDGRLAPRQSRLIWDWESPAISAKASAFISFSRR